MISQTVGDWPDRFPRARPWAGSRSGPVSGLSGVLLGGGVSQMPLTALSGSLSGPGSHTAPRHSSRGRQSTSGVTPCCWFVVWFRSLLKARRGQIGVKYQRWWIDGPCDPAVCSCKALDRSGPGVWHFAFPRVLFIIPIAGQRVSRKSAAQRSFFEERPLSGMILQFVLTVFALYSIWL